MKYIKSSFKYVTALSFAGFLLYFVFRDIDLHSMFDRIKTADLRWVYLSIILSLISHMVRAYRWNILLKPMGYSPPVGRTFMAVMTGYFVNLLVPRMGELSRCAILKKTDNIPMTSSLGSVVAERILDFFVLLIIIVFTLILEADTLMGFILNLINNNLQNGRLFIIIITITGLFIIGLIVLILLKKHKEKIKNNKFFEKIKPGLKQFVNGITSLRLIDNKQGFYLSTILIWILYFFMAYVIVFAFEETSGLGIRSGFSILMAGGLGMAAPVQGGIGTYHAFVSGALFLYGIPKDIGVTFATLLHTSQFISITVFGGLSFIISLIFAAKKKKYANK